MSPGIALKVVLAAPTTFSRLPGRLQILHGDQVIDMPLLYETGAYMLTWPRMLVKCDPETQVRRPCMILVKSGMHACCRHALDHRCSNRFIFESLNVAVGAFR